MNIDIKLLKNNQLEIEGNFINLTKDTYEKPIVIWDLTVKNWLLPTSTSAFAISAQHYGQCNQARKENKIQIGKEAFRLERKK